MDGWRWTWATTGAVVFVGFIGIGINWFSVTPARSNGPLYAFFVLAALGLVIFVLAMVHPQCLLGYKRAKREEDERRKAELAHEGDKERVRGMQAFTTPHSAGAIQRENTQALNRNTEVARRLLENQQTED